MGIQFRRNISQVVGTTIYSFHCFDFLNITSLQYSNPLYKINFNENSFLNVKTQQLSKYQAVV